MKRTYAVEKIAEKEYDATHGSVVVDSLNRLWKRLVPREVQADSFSISFKITKHPILDEYEVSARLEQ